MSLQKQINDDFVTAFKAKDILTKDCLGLLKTKISEFLKKNNATDISDSDVLTIIASETKKRKQAIELYLKNEGEVAKVNAAKEEKEVQVLAKYLPAQLTDVEISAEIYNYMRDVNIGSMNVNQLVGSIMKHFNTNFKGRFDNTVLKGMIELSLLT